MYVLYGGGLSRAVGPRMVLEEAGYPFEFDGPKDDPVVYAKLKKLTTK